MIEPSAGADRATLAFLCEAYTEDEAPDENGKPAKRVSLKLHPRLAPIKAAVFPLVKKDGMPEIAREIYSDLKPHLDRLLRRKGGRRPSLSPSGRGGHALLHHGRQPDASRRHGDHPRPRHAQAMARGEGRVSGSEDAADGVMSGKEMSWPREWPGVNTGHTPVPPARVSSKLGPPMFPDPDPESAIPFDDGRAWGLDRPGGACYLYFRLRRPRQTPG